jgi:hypothetical protein
VAIPADSPVMHALESFAATGPAPENRASDRIEPDYRLIMPMLVPPQT